MRIYTITSKAKVGQFITDLVGDLNRWSGDKPLTVTMQGKKERRSLDQNSLLWKWYQIIADETGNDKDDIHEYCKACFLGYEDIYVKKNRYHYSFKVPVSTKRQSVQSMAEYMEKIQAWAATDLGINLPSGDDPRIASLETR